MTTRTQISREYVADAYIYDGEVAELRKIVAEMRRRRQRRQKRLIRISVETGETRFELGPEFDREILLERLADRFDDALRERGKPCGEAWYEQAGHERKRVQGLLDELARGGMPLPTSKICGGPGSPVHAFLLTNDCAGDMSIGIPSRDERVDDGRWQERHALLIGVSVEVGSLRGVERTGSGYVLRGDVRAARVFVLFTEKVPEDGPGQLRSMDGGGAENYHVEWPR